MFCSQILLFFFSFFRFHFHSFIVMNSFCKQFSLSLFFDFENQLFVVVNELNNQFIIVKKFSAFFFFIFFIFFNISPNFEIIRRRVFDASKIWIWTVAKHEFYWFFVNNLWIFNTKKKIFIKKNIRAQYFLCRFWKSFVDKIENYERRFKTVRLFLSEDWFICINWLELELHVFDIQTNRCFIRNRIRDLLCIWRFSIEIFNDYRISLIHDLFLVFKILELKFMQFFWLHRSTNISKFAL